MKNLKDLEKEINENVQAKKRRYKLIALMYYNASILVEVSDGKVQEEDFVDVVNKVIKIAGKEDFFTTLSAFFSIRHDVLEQKLKDDFITTNNYSSEVIFRTYVRLNMENIFDEIDAFE